MTTDTVGGVWTYCLNLAEALRDHGVQICLAAKGKVAAHQLEAASHLSHVTLVTEDFKLEWMNDPWNDVRDAGQWLLEIARDFNPDVIHLNEYCHAELPWRVPVIVVGHSCVLSWLAAVRGGDVEWQWGRYRREVQRGLQAADIVVAPTRHMLSALDYFYGPLGVRQVILNGCNPQKYWSGMKQPIVFSAGRFWDEAKNLATLAAAAPDIEWPVAVAGLCQPHGDDGQVDGVAWLGSLSQKQMAVEYAAASIYALPALYEPFGLTALEAALSRCALVLGDIPSLREIWGNAACFVPPRDAGRLADTINQLIDMPDYRDDMAQRALMRGRQLTGKRMAAAYVDCYQQLIAAGQASHFQGTR